MSEELTTTDDTPQLPTYKSVAALLERKTGSGLKLFGWTVARTILIAPPMWAAGRALDGRVDGFTAISWRQAFIGAGIASALISSLAVLRVAKTENQMAKNYFAGRKWTEKKIKPPRGMKRIA